MVKIADRTVRVTLAAEVNGYLANMERAAAKTRDVGTAAEKMAAQRQGFDVLGRSMLAVGAAAAAGVGLAVAKFADFDAQMSSVQAATHETAGNMDLLRAAALDAGQSTVFTATEAAQAIENLSKAGVETTDILGGGLKGALDLAAAGQLAVGDAAEIAATAMTQFNLEGTQVPHIADLLAAGAGKAQGEVTDLAAALNQSGLVASQMGLSIEETTGTLASFASAGLIGSDAGTSFRTMLLRLANPTEEAKDLMSDLGIAAYDAQGNFVGMESIAGQLQDKMGGLNQSTRDAAMATLFGSDAIRAANVLYTQGADGIAEWTANVDDAGYAAETAALRMDNLQGDIEKLGGALDTALIQTGSAANGALRGLTQALTDVVDGFNDLDPAAQGVALAVGGVVSAAALAGGAFFVAVPKIADFNAALQTMGPGAQRAGAAVGILSKALGVFAALGTVGVVAGQISDSFRDFGMGIEEATQSILRNDLSAIFSGISDEVGNFGEGLKLLTGDDVNSSMERFGSSINGVFGGALPDQVADARDAFATTGEALAGLVNSGHADIAKEQFDAMAEAADLQGVSVGVLNDLMPSYTEALAGVANEGALAAESGNAAADAATALGGAADDASAEVEALGDAIRNFGSATLDARAANRELEQAVDDATAAVKENGKTLDITTEKGRKNQSALDDIASSANDAAASTWENTRSEKALQGSLSTSRERLIAAATQFGMSKKAAEAYADKVLATPKAVKTTVTANTATAEGNLSRVKNGLAGIQNKTVTVTVRQNYIQATTSGQSGKGSNIAGANGMFNEYANGGMQSFASGGNGIYTGGTPLYKFAEPETGWEAFISGKRGMERQNLGYAYESISRLEKQLGMAGGGGSGVTVQITNHNPVAQPESESIRTASQYLGAIIGGGH